jgi:hypothetical protein
VTWRSLSTSLRMTRCSCPVWYYLDHHTS